MVTQPQQMELDLIREKLKTLEGNMPTITTRKWSLNLDSESKTVDIYNITVRANGKVISVRNPANWYYYEGIQSNDGGISDFFLTNAIVQWQEGDNTVNFDYVSSYGGITNGVLYQATDAFNLSVYTAEKIGVKLSDFGLTGPGTSINIKYSVTVETV